MFLFAVFSVDLGNLSYTKYLTFRWEKITWDEYESVWKWVFMFPSLFIWEIGECYLWKCNVFLCVRYVQFHRVIEKFQFHIYSYSRILGTVSFPYGLFSYLNYWVASWWILSFAKDCDYGQLKPLVWAREHFCWILLSVSICTES